jgi:hypothetical protein
MNNYEHEQQYTPPIAVLVICFFTALILWMETA